MTRLRLISPRLLSCAVLALAGCAGTAHHINVEPMGAYASELLPTAHRSLSHGASLSLPTDVACDVRATVDARDGGRAGAALNSVAASQISIRVVVDARCGEEVWASDVTHEIIAGPGASDRRSALAAGIDLACREAASQLSSLD